MDETGLPVAQVAELTGLLPGLTAAGWPEGMRVLVRRERPHSGAQISLFEAHDGWRYQCVATDTGHGQLAFRVLAQVETKNLRYRLLHTAARIVRGQRKVRIRIDSTWPWAVELSTEFTRLDEIRQPLII